MEITAYAGSNVSIPVPVHNGVLEFVAVGPAKITKTGADACTFTPLETATWATGQYQFHLFDTDTNSRVLLRMGRLVVRPDPAAITQPVDPRTWAEIALDAVQSVLAGSATYEQSEFEIAGRKLKSHPLADLLSTRRKLLGEVNKERAKANGQSPSSIQSITVRYI